jgi:hypothetical protein
VTKIKNNHYIGISNFCSYECYWANMSSGGKSRSQIKRETAINLYESRILKPEDLITGVLGFVKDLSEPIELKKDIIDRDKEYLIFVREHRCIVCGKKCTQAHHIEKEGLGIKCSDYKTVPLCEACHTGDYGVELIGRREFEKNHLIDFNLEVIKLQMEYIRRLKNKND